MFHIRYFSSITSYLFTGFTLRPYRSSFTRRFFFLFSRSLHFLLPELWQLSAKLKRCKVIWAKADCEKNFTFLGEGFQKIFHQPKAGLHTSKKRWQKIMNLRLLEYFKNYCTKKENFHFLGIISLFLRSVWFMFGQLSLSTRTRHIMSSLRQMTEQVVGDKNF